MVGNGEFWGMVFWGMVHSGEWFSGERFILGNCILGNGNLGSGFRGNGIQSNVVNNIPCTSNAIEGYHNKFNSQLKVGSEMKFYAVIRAFMQEEMSTTADYMRYIQGDMPADRRNIQQKRKDERLKHLVQERSDQKIDLFSHIQGLALVLHNK